MKKVKAKVREIFIEPEYEAAYKCPFCKKKNTFSVEEDDSGHTTNLFCPHCKKEFQIQIPDFI